MHATLHTNHGDIRLELFPDKAPKTVASFTGLAKGEPTWKDEEIGQDRSSPFYDGLVFHRVISGFMIQGGCPSGKGTGGPGYTFDDEIAPDLQFDKPYILAMANSGSRGGKGTNGSQFFITVGPTPHLTGKHTILRAGSRRPGPGRGRQDRRHSGGPWRSAPERRGHRVGHRRGRLIRRNLWS